MSDQTSASYVPCGVHISCFCDRKWVDVQQGPCLDSNYDYVVTYSPNPTAVCIYLFAFASNDARQESYCKIIFHTNEHLFKLLEIIFNSFCA